MHRWCLLCFSFSLTTSLKYLHYKEKMKRIFRFKDDMSRSSLLGQLYSWLSRKFCLQLNIHEISIRVVDIDKRERERKIMLIIYWFLFSWREDNFCFESKSSRKTKYYFDKKERVIFFTLTLLLFHVYWRQDDRHCTLVLQKKETKNICCDLFLCKKQRRRARERIFFHFAFSFF